VNNVYHHDHIAAKLQEYLDSGTWLSPAAAFHFYGVPGMIASEYSVWGYLECLAGVQKCCRNSMIGDSTMRDFS